MGGDDLMAFVQDSRPSSSWTNDTPVSSTWTEDDNRHGATYFDTWDDSFDLVTTSFDTVATGQNFTEDTHV